MKVFIALLAIASLAYATDVPILRNDQDISPDGTFSFNYETGDGILHQASGDANSVHGNFKYSSPEGEHVDITYVADENGYQATGSHVPVAPAIPEGIARALEYIRAHPPKDASEGAYVE